MCNFAGWSPCDGDSSIPTNGNDNKSPVMTAPDMFKNLITSYLIAFYLTDLNLLIPPSSPLTPSEEDNNQEF